MLKHKKRVPDLLCLALFILIFINGFESGGYQASLHTIGKVYDLSITSMGLFATVELFLLGHGALYSVFREDVIHGRLCYRGHWTKFA